MTEKKILILYTELAGYMIACLKALSTAGVQVHVVRYPVNKEAPFKFNDDLPITFYNRNDFDAQKLYELYKNIQPDAIICSGWVDADYVKLCAKAKAHIPTILALDNQWENSPKQKIAALLSPVLSVRHFTDAWVPGEPQAMFARKLGFKANHIFKGFYSADTSLFEPGYKIKEQQEIPHRFLFVGRYLAFKGIYEMWDGFLASKKETNHDWELWCVGTGDEYNQRVENDSIKHFGFIQPEQLNEIIASCGVFVLPSHREPWGVVVHEMAAAGLPLICSNTVGAASEFLEPNKNGILIEPNDANALKKAFIQFSKMPQEELKSMSQYSAKLSKKISPSIWVKTLLEILN